MMMKSSRPEEKTKLKVNNFQIEKSKKRNK